MMENNGGRLPTIIEYQDVGTHYPRVSQVANMPDLTELWAGTEERLRVSDDFGALRLYVGLQQIFAPRLSNPL